MNQKQRKLMIKLRNKQFPFVDYWKIYPALYWFVGVVCVHNWEKYTFRLLKIFKYLYKVHY